MKAMYGGKLCPDSLHQHAKDPAKYLAKTYREVKADRSKCKKAYPELADRSKYAFSAQLYVLMGCGEDDEAIA